MTTAADIPNARPIHGGIKPAELRALGLHPADCLDFSASVSPLGPPAAVAPAIAAVNLAAYPDPHCLDLKDAIAAHHAADQVAPANISVGNGSTELIHLLARAYIAAPPPGCSNSALLLTPTYGEYAGAARTAGGAVHTLDAVRSPHGFSWDLDAAARRIAAHRPVLVFICNPNNPTGALLTPDDLRLLTSAIAAAGSLLVVDEAYINLADAGADAAAIPIAMSTDSAIILRSMTKDYALTALRLGYAIARPPVIARLDTFQPDWSVNGLAQAAGIAALSAAGPDADYLERARAAVAAARQRIVDGLAALGIPCYPAAANFVLAPVGDATALRNALARQGLFVRDCASFGLPDCIRIGLRPVDDCDRLVNAITALRNDIPMP